MELMSKEILQKSVSSENECEESVALPWIFIYFECKLNSLSILHFTYISLSEVCMKYVQWERRERGILSHQHKQQKKSDAFSFSFVTSKLFTAENKWFSTFI